ncbi:MAG: GntR family transcriptional regulator [Eubacteriales bacterium]|nr:GntR family transcriptional regulator [Eubacteriales bacterium]
MTANEIYEDLKNQILYLELKPGDMISETELCDKYGISRTPIRDVIKKLVSEDLLEVKPHIGSFVSPINLSKVSDTIFIRQTLELAILKDIYENFSMSDALPFQQLLNEQAEIAKLGTTQDVTHAFAISDNAFHAKLYELSGKNGVWQTIISLNHHYMRFRTLLVQSHSDPVTTLYEQHCDMLNALMNHDWNTLSTLCSDHITSGFHRSAELLQANSDYFTQQK